VPRVKFPLWLITLSNSNVDPPFGAQETLRSWQKKNHPWLELSDVHKETTEDIRVTVIPFYMGYRESQTSSVYWVNRLFSTFFFSATNRPLLMD